MQTSPSTSKWWQNAWAAFIFFTRLPLWRIYQPPRESYQAVIEYWPLTGWLTGSVMAATLYFGHLWMPFPLTIVVTILARVLLMGAFHEDGLADFIDGFGGGGSHRQRILDIMKDSHIGTYGVIGLIFYFLLLATTLYSLPVNISVLAIMAGDPFAKMLSGQVIQMLPYARKEEEAKVKVVYRKIKMASAIGLAVQGLLPLALFLYTYGDIMPWEYLLFVPCLVMYGLYLLIWNRLKGYTGDCCGAICLMVELSFYLTVAVIVHQS